MKVGILLHFDPTVGTIKSELLFLPKLLKLLNQSSVTLIKGMQRADKLLSDYDVGCPYNIVDVVERGEYDVIIAWNSTNMANFFGGAVSGSNVKYYEFMSYYTNSGIPILYRSGDSENEIYDYRDLAVKRRKKELAAGKSKFSDGNKDLLDRLEVCLPIDYKQYYLIVNGERNKFDWVNDTYAVRKPHPHLVGALDQALYLGDDLFFQVNEKYDKTFLSSEEDNDSMFWIGFIEHRNAGRKKIFAKLFADSKSLPASHMTIQSNTEFILPGVNCVHEEIEGDTTEYFKLLGKHLAYVFIGKGTEKCAYINKTVYDCVIARLPVFVYDPCDQTGMVFADIPECRFSTIKELEQLYIKICDPIYRNKIVSNQHYSILKRLETNEITKLQKMFEHIPREQKTFGLMEF